jgi:hypothetical protein
MTTQIFPELHFNSECPRCRASVKANDWLIPGLWCLGSFECNSCGFRFLMDIPYSLGVVSPCVLDLDSSRVSSTKPSYAHSLEQAYQARSFETVSLTIERTPIQCHCLFVNTLYPCFGDALSLLLRINALRDQPVIVLVNRALVWLVPDWVAGIWVLERSHSKNVAWSDSLTSAIKLKAHEYELALSIPTTFQPCHLSSEELLDFTRIKPFPRDLWTEKLSEQPVVTFMWRTDRVWPDPNRSAFLHSLMSKSGLSRKIWRRFLMNPAAHLARRQQLGCLIRLAEGLRSILPNLEFAVCGLDRQGKLPSWITDRRVDEINDATNREWAEQGARSHILLGVLGSHTVLPGSLSGAYLELVPTSMAANVLTTAPVLATEVREAIFSYRLIPADVSVNTLQAIIIQTLLDYPYKKLTTCHKYYKSINPAELEHVRQVLSERCRFINSLSTTSRIPPYN